MTQVNFAIRMDKEILSNEGVIFEYVIQKCITERENRNIVKLGNAEMLKSA